MAIKFTIKQAAYRADPASANVVLRAGVCSGGTNYARYELDPGQDPTSSVGYGPLAGTAAQASRLGGAKQILLKIPATTAGTISSVTKTPSNATPTITVAGTNFDSVTNSPFDAFNVKVKVKHAGLPGVAVVDVALDGENYKYTFDVPAETPAAAIGTVDLTGITLADLNTLTFIATSDIGGPITITLTTPTSVADIATQITAGFASGTDEAAAELVAGKYLRVYSLTNGATSTLSIGAGTANTILGMTAGSAPGGSASKITLPGTGLIVTCPATASYILDTVESFTTTAPRHSQANLETGLAQANADTLAWGLLEVVQEPVDGTDLRSVADGLDAVAAGWEAQEDKRFVPWFIGAPLDATDQQLKNAMSGHQARYGAIAAGDIYTTASAPMPLGTFRRSSARPLGIRLAAQSLSEDPGFGGFGPLPECSMKGPAGALARNESTATTKLGTSKGPGFTVIKAKNGLPYFVRGVTRAGQNSLFVDIGVQRMSAYAATIIYAALRDFENPTFDLNADGTLQESDAASLEEAFEAQLRRLLVQAKHASAVIVSVDRTEKVSETRNITVTWTVQIRGQAEDITGTLSLVGELNINGQKAA